MALEKVGHICQMHNGIGFLKQSSPQSLTKSTFATTTTLYGGFALIIFLSTLSLALSLTQFCAVILLCSLSLGMAPGCGYSMPHQDIISSWLPWLVRRSLLFKGLMQSNGLTRLCLLGQPTAQPPSLTLSMTSTVNGRLLPHLLGLQSTNRQTQESLSMTSSVTAETSTHP